MALYLTTGLILGLTAGIAPGPLLAFIISQTLNFGTAEGAKAALAPMISDLPIIGFAFIVVWGLAAVDWVPGLLSLAGAGYIAYLAWGNLRIKPNALTLRPARPKSIQKGILINLLNPHPYFFWLTVGVPFLSETWGGTPASAMLWVAGFYFALVGSKLTLAAIVGRMRSFLTSRIYLWINRGLAVVLLVFAVFLVKNGLTLLRGSLL